MKNKYSTRDLYLASALITKGCSLVATDTDSTVVYFVFDDYKKCLKLQNEYEFGEVLVNARDYKDQIIRLKNIVFN